MSHARFGVATLMFALLALFSHAAAVPAAAQGKDAAAAARKVKEGIARVCCGPRARVKLTVQGVGKVEGFVESAGEESFALVRTDKGHVGHGLTVAYADVARIRGRELSVNWQKVGAGGLLGARALLRVLSNVRPQFPPVPARR